MCNLVDVQMMCGIYINDRHPDAHRNIYDIHCLLSYTLHLHYAMVHTHSPPSLVLDDIILNGWIHLMFMVSVTAPVSMHTVPLILICITR